MGANIGVTLSSIVAAGARGNTSSFLTLAAQVSHVNLSEWVHLLRHPSLKLSVKIVLQIIAQPRFCVVSECT